MATSIELKTKFTKLLKEMFQLDQPELDFGLYKIMHSKAERINRFLDVELANQIDAVFADADQANQNQAIEAAKQTLVGQLGEGAFDENGELVEHFKTVPAAKDYLNAVAQARSGKGNLSERAMIYDHLIRFFSRYYDGGDFMSRRYHVAENKSRAAAYAVPYDGSEVYLHWANKDQYYIKTTESFNQYSFDIAEAAKLQEEQTSKSGQTKAKEMTPQDLNLEDFPPLAHKRIHFKLVDVEQGEHNNNKESEKRQFFIRAEQPIELNEAGELEVYLEFRVAGKSDVISAEQEKQLKARFGASNKGDLPNLYITQVIQDALLAMQEQPGLVDFVKFSQILAPTDKIKQRPLLTKYLNNYTSKNTMDYFIHKDLGGFLQRELDFYIKNEIMRLDDIEQADEVSYGRLIKQIKTLRGVAKEIIQFLAQLEDFQKKLWLKKKFVTETQYCITLDRLQNQPGLIEIALSNEAQRQEWVSLFAIDLAELDALKAQGIDAFLANEKYRYLVLDTQFFDTAFKDELLTEVDGLDEESNGLLINSDNFHGLNLISNLYDSSIDCIHVDPPYNTDTSGFLYKNSYRHSSWMSMMNDRVLRGIELLKDSGDLLIHIDENEYENLDYLCKDINLFNPGTVVWDKRNPMTGGKGIAIQHEYVVWRTKHNQTINFRNDSILSMLAKSEALIKEIGNGKVTKEVRDRFSKWVNNNSNLSGGEKAFKFIDDNGLVYRGVSLRAPEPRINKKFHIPLIHPITGKPCPVPPNGFSRTPETLQEMLENDEIIFGCDENSQPQQKAIMTVDKFRQVTSIVADAKKGKFYTDALGVVFPYCHPVSLYNTLIGAVLHDVKGFVLDYFAGSGTTGHAVINLNREDQGNRKYILCEMGTYFDSVTKPRIEKVIYAKDWKDGKPIFDSEGKAGGVSQCFKYLRLESYEDTLNNLIDSRTYQPESVPKDFVLSYLLEAETAESPSLLNLQQFSTPRNYQLQIKRPNSDQCISHEIDLVETFNWLIGLNVVKLDKWRAYDCEFEREHDPELPNDQHTRLKIKGKLKQADAYAEDAPVYQIRTVEGWVRRQPGNDELRDSVLVIWRNLSDDSEKDSAVLEALLEKLAINQADSQFDKIYINGPHGLQLHGSAKTRLLSLEDTFMTKMWEGS